MIQFDFNIIYVYLGSVGQEFSNFTKLGHITAGFLITANPVIYRACGRYDINYSWYDKSIVDLR